MTQLQHRMWKCNLTHPMIHKHCTGCKIYHLIQPITMQPNSRVTGSIFINLQSFHQIFHKYDRLQASLSIIDYCISHHTAEHCPFSASHSCKDIALCFITCLITHYFHISFATITKFTLPENLL